MSHKLWAALGLSVIMSASLAEASDNHTRADTHAPIGVMGEHMHKKGEVMFSYRYMNMRMDGNRSGTSDVSTASVLGNFMVAPLSMDMQMHMLGGMYGVTDNITLMTMIPYHKKSMDHRNRMGVEFTTRSEGIGDVKLSSMVRLLDQHSDMGHHHAHVTAGISLPTGSIDKSGTTPMGPNMRLPYPMQLGSGTVDPMIGLTYTNTRERFSWGAQTSAVVPFYDNSQSYHLGEEVTGTIWAATPVSGSISLGARLNAKAWGDIDGADPTLNPAMVPTARTDLRAGERADASVSVNFLQGSGEFKNHRLAAEIGIPIYQRLDGPQLETEWIGTIGWQYSF